MTFVLKASTTHLASLYSERIAKASDVPHSQLFVQALKNGHVPFQFCLESDKSAPIEAFISISAEATVAEAFQVVEDVLFPTAIQEDEAILSVDNIAIPMEAMKEHFLSHVILIHACTRKYVNMF